MGMANARSANLGASLKLYRTALAELEALGEREHVASLHFMVAENLRLLGELKESWRHRQEALALGSRVGNSFYYYASLLDGAETALRQDLPGVALIFQNEMVDFATGDPLLSTESLIRRSRTSARLGLATAVDRDLQSARSFLDQVPAGERHDRLEADLDAARGESLLRRQPRAALEPLERALEIYQRQGESFRLPSIYQMQAHARIATGDALGSEEALRKGIADSERQRESVDEDALRVASFDQAHPIFDDMIGLLIDRGDPEGAFRFAERSRTRNLLEAFARSDRKESRNATGSRIAVGTLGAAEIRERLPEGVGLIEFVVMDGRVAVWFLSRITASRVLLPVGRSWLEEKVEALRESLLDSADSKSFVDRSQELFRTLLRPLEAQLDSSRVLVIVPDKSLNLLPFAALIDPRTGEYLIQGHAISLSPSATMYVQALERARSLHVAGPATALVMGDPDFDHEIFPGLPQLDDARAEARDVASLYGSKGSRLLVGAEATKAAFLKEAPAFTIVHLGSHTVLNDQYPQLSALPLAPGEETGGRGSGVLYAREIYQMQFSRTRLVALASCESGLGPVSESEGAFGLARAFLGAGVPAVISSSWSIGDRVSSQFFLSFHRFLAQGHDPLTALRSAQLAMLHGADGSLAAARNWAGFQLIGGTLMENY
jgi:CHAT domain-containing protein